MSSSKSLSMFRYIIFIQCIALFLQTGNATGRLLHNDLKAFDHQKCALSVTKVGVCLTDLWTNFGRPSVACCKALEEIDDTCVPSLFPQNPFTAPLLKSLCSSISGGGGSGGGALPFPFPFPFPIPFPPIGGGGGFPFPPAFPLPGVGGGASPPTYSN